MDGHRELVDTLLEVMGDEGCGVSCEENADIFQDDEGWKLRLCGFMEPWKLGTTVSEARAALTELGSMHFGLS